MRCTVCGSEENIQRHHLSYEPEVTIFLCRKCHTLIHRKRKIQRSMKKILQGVWTFLTKWRRRKILVSKKVKPHGKIKVFKKNMAYLPKLVIDEVGKYPCFIVDAKTVLIFDEAADPVTLLRSLEMLKDHIILRCGLKREDIEKLLG